MATKAKTAAKAAPAPVETDEVVFEVGASVRFLGYDEDTPEEEQHLTAGEVYEIFALTDEDENGEGGGHPVIQLENPNFNPKKKESESNTKFLEVEVLPHEVEMVEAEAEEEEAEEEEAEEAPPVKVAKAAKAAPAKDKKTAPAAAKKKAPKTEDVSEEPVNETPDLVNEDEEVVALVEGSEDLIQLAQELEAQAAATDWQLGGVLYHIKKDKSYEAVEGGKEYAEKGGFEKFLQEYFNVEYRKAMWLIQIYRDFTLAGIENPAQRVAAMGWTKAKTISKLLIAPEANTEELLELADNNTVADLSEAIKEQVTVGGTKGTPGTKVQRITVKFRLVEEEGKSVTAILETAKEQLGLKDIGQAFVHIVNEWGSANGGGVATKAAAPKATAKAAAPKAAAKPATKKVLAKAA